LEISYLFKQILQPPSSNIVPPVTRWQLLQFQEIKRERAKAAAAIKTLQERMEEKLRVELDQKVCICFSP
jgi:hypothetical protein